MTEYAIIFGMEVLAIVVALCVSLLNASNPTLVQSIKPVLWGCFGLPTAFMYTFILYFIRDFIEQYYGKRPDILRSFIAMLTAMLIVPLMILETAFPGQGWMVAILLAGLIWGCIPILGMIYRIFVAFAKHTDKP